MTNFLKKGGINSHLSNYWVLYSAIFFSIIYSFYTWPLVLNFTSHIPGNPKSDVYLYLWNLSFEKDQLFNFIPFKTSKLFAPHGVNISALYFNPLMTFICKLFSNKALGINLFLFINFLLSGIGGFLLSKRYISNFIPCLIVGFIFAFSPWKTARLTEHYNLVLTGFVPFYMLFLLKGFSFNRKQIVTIKNIKYVLLCFLAGLLTLLSDPVTAVTLFIFTIFYFILQFVRFPKKANLDIKKVLILVAIIVAGHYVMASLNRMLDNNGAFWWDSDLLALIVPWNNLAVASLFPQKLIDYIHPRGLENVMYFGITFLAIGIFVRIKKNTNKFSNELFSLFSVGLILLFLTMPQIRVAGFDLFNNPLSVFHFIPGLNSFRCPGRLIMLVYLLVSISIFYKLNDRSIRRFFPLIGLFLIIEYSPTDMQTIKTKDIPGAYQVVKKTEGEILLTLPFGIRDGKKQSGKVNVRDLWYQSFHQKKLIGGYVSRLNNDVRKFYHQDTVMRTLLKSQTDTSLEIPNFSKQQKNSFFGTYQPGIVLISPAYRESKSANLINQVTKGRIKMRIESNGYLILELKEY